MPLFFNLDRNTEPLIVDSLFVASVQLYTFLLCEVLPYVATALFRSAADPKVGFLRLDTENLKIM